MANHTGYIYPSVLHDDPTLIPVWNESVFYTDEADGWVTDTIYRVVHTNTQPVVEPAIHHNAVRMISFVDDFYNRIIIEPGNIDVGNLVSEQYYEINVFNGYFEEKELQNLSTQDADGLLITGPTPPQIWGLLETKAYQLTISTDGPPSINAKILFDFVGVSDDITVSVGGSRIVMIPFQAELPWSESLEWKTNVLTTNDGSEQRIRLRKKARQSVTANYPIPAEYTAKSFNMLYGWAQRTWAVALWSETQYIGTVNPGVTAIYCDTANYDFRPNSLVCLWQSNEMNEVIEVEEVFADNISLKRVLTGNYDNAILMPVRIGVASTSISRKTNGYTSNAHIEYDFKDNIDLNPSAPIQYLGYDIYFDRSLMPGDSLEDKFISRIDVVDYETGIVDHFPSWKYNKRARNVQFINEDPQETWVFRKWLHRRAGRLRPYWLPTFEENFRIAMQGNVGSTIKCQPDDYRNLGDDHNHIAIQYEDGSWVARTITGHSVETGGLINIAIDTALNVDAKFIRLISFLTLHRLDTDKVDIEFVGNGVNVSTIRLIEIKP